MRRSLLGLALVCTLAAASYKLARLQGEASDVSQRTIVDRYQLQWSHATEQAWIADAIAEAILGWSDAPGGPQGRASVAIDGEPSAPQVTLTFAPNQKLTLTIDHHIWSPASYVPLVAVALGKSGPDPVRDAPVLPSSLEPLTIPLPEVIQQENARISTALTADRRSADAHEEAALVLGALALREAAGDFSDTRQIMSRMTAHLAIARRLRSSPGTAGRVADALLLTLAGRERDALEVISALDATDAPGLKPWLRALRLRNTGDWRPTRDEQSLTLLERLETLRAIHSTLGNDRALEYLDTFRDPAPPASWLRLIMQGGASVEAGNRFSEAAFQAELDQAQRLRAVVGDGQDVSTQDAAVAELNAAPLDSAVDPRDGSIRVIDWGLWGAASQRHVLMAVRARYRHLNDMVGLPDAARAYAREATDTLRALTLFPLLRPYLSHDLTSHTSALAAAADVCRRRPDLVTFEVWETLFQKPSFAKQASTDALPPNGIWFTPLIAAGTVFDLPNRALDDTVRPPQPRLTLLDAQRLRALAPSQRQLALDVVRMRDGNFPRYTVMQKEYGELAAYDLIVARRIARAAAETPEAYVPLMRHVADLNPETLGELGAYLADRGRVGEAQAVYEEWLEKARDAVAVSNGAYWLVRRYHDLGDAERAERLARSVADVYSYLGLMTLGDLYDWRNRVTAARRAYQTAAERYDNYSDLLGFYLRRVAQNPSLQPEIDQLTPKIFPKGIERAALQDLTTEPADGVRLIDVGDTGRRAGLRNYDIVVALDGVRVHDIKQFRVARRAGLAPEMQFIVWRGGQYVAATAPVRVNWPVCNLMDYVRGRAAVATR